MSTRNKQVRIPTATIEALQLLTTIRGKKETIGQVIEVAVDLLTQSMIDTTNDEIKTNQEIILEYYKSN